MDNTELRIQELEAALAQVTAERDQLADQLATKDNGFDFGRAMARIEAKQQDNDLYRQQREAAFEQGLAEPTKFI